MLVKKEESSVKNIGRVVKLVDTLLLGSSAVRHGSSSLPSPTNLQMYEINVQKITHDIVATVILGEPGSFLPSGIVQWLILALFVLFGVVLIRKIFDVDKRYHKKPMKHD